MRAILLAVLLLAGCASPADPTQAASGADTDGDGYPDELEQRLGSDPADPTSIPDVVAHLELSLAETATILLGTEDPTSGCGVHGTIDRDVLPWTLVAPANSTGAKVSDLTVTATLPPTMLELDIFVIGPDGTELTGATTATIPPSNTDRVAVEGAHPTGEYRIEIRGCEGSGEIEVEATARVHYTPSVEELMHAQGVQHHH